MGRQDPSSPTARQAEIAALSPHHERFAGDLASLFRKHRAGLAGLAEAFVGRPEDAEDVVQDAYLRLLVRGPPAVPPQFAYVARAVANTARDHLRRRAAYQRALGGLAGRTTGQQVGSPERTYVAGRAAERLGRALEVIPPRQACAFRMLTIDGASARTAAERLGVKRRTVIQLAYRGRVSLRMALQKVGMRSADDL